MLWAGSDAWIYLASNCVGVGGIGDARLIHTDSPLDGWRKALQHMSDTRSRWRSRRVDLVVSGAIGRPFVLSEVSGLKSLADARRIAAAIAPEATGIESACDVWFQEQAPGRFGLAVAIAADLRDEIVAAAKTHKVWLRSIEPWWAIAVRESASEYADARVLTAEDTDALTILVEDGHGKGYAAASTHWPVPSTVARSGLIRRSLVANDMQASQGVSAYLAHVRDTGSMMSIKPSLERMG